jgi:hypothetical protein
MTSRRKMSTQANKEGRRTLNKKNNKDSPEGAEPNDYNNS